MLDHPSSWSSDEDFVTYFQGLRFQVELRHFGFFKVLHPFAEVNFTLAGFGAVFIVPLAHGTPQVITFPKPTIVHGRQSSFPFLKAGWSVSASFQRIQGLPVTFGGGVHIIGTTATTFNFEYSYSGFGHLVQKIDGTQVFGRHDVFVVYLKLCSTLFVGHDVRATAILDTSPAIGG